MVLSRVCQVVIGDAIQWPAWPNLEDLASRFQHVPGPSSQPEGLFAMGMLLHFTEDLGALIHRRVHAAYPSGPCAFNPLTHVGPPRLDPANPEAWKPGEAMRAWAKDFGQAFARSHPRPVSERAKQRLSADLTEKLTVAAVARHSGCSVSVLHRRFAKESRETPGRYRARIRILKAIACLRQTDWKVEAVARAVGWKSKKDLYKWLDRLTGLKPKAIRALPEADVDRIVASLGGAKLVAGALVA